ncbi:aminoglycoside phosphotransferase family protein [Histidinibacterium aquaticum]|nr:aminoglycoside phosphotransferase family protein [Histidinibacterium aquaticum]
MSPFAPWLERWTLAPDGAPIRTPSSDLLPVRAGDRPAMLKLARSEEERRGAALLRWLGSGTAAEVLEFEGPALLLERATGPDLVTLALTDDAAATEVILEVASRLHQARAHPPETEPLSDYLAALLSPRGAARFPGEAALARDLLESTTAPLPLHGDLHHGNILDFGGRWRVIDPKGLHGDRTFDFARLFFNPDAIDPAHGLAIRPQVFVERLARVSSGAGLDPDRLRGWIRVKAAVSMLWQHGAPDPLTERIKRLTESPLTMNIF